MSFTSRSFEKKSARDEGSSSGRITTEEATPMAGVNVADLAEVLEMTDCGKVVSLAQFRERVGAEAAVGRPEPMSLEAAARVAGRLASVREELMAALRELDAERERGCEDAGMYHVALGFTALDVERVSKDLAREYGGE